MIVKSPYYGASVRSVAVAGPLIVKSQVKSYLNEKKFRFSPGSIDALSDLLATLMDSAIARAQESGRKTVKAEDYQYLHEMWVNPLGGAL